MEEKFKSFTAAVHTTNRYVCSICFGKLVVEEHWKHAANGELDFPGSWFGVICQNYLDLHTGFVTNTYAVNTRMRSYIDLVDVLSNGIADLLGVNKVAAARAVLDTVPPMARLDPAYQSQIIDAIERLHSIVMADQHKSFSKMTAEQAINVLFGD